MCNVSTKAPDKNPKFQQTRKLNVFLPRFVIYQKSSRVLNSFFLTQHNQSNPHVQYFSTVGGLPIFFHECFHRKPQTSTCPLRIYSVLKGLHDFFPPIKARCNTVFKTRKLQVFLILTI